jgi:hypothetical protein
MKSISVSMKAVMTTMAILFMTILTVPVMAGAPPTDEPSSVQVKYLGSVNEQNIFEVSVAAIDNEAFIISVKTGAGETLYTEKSSGKAYSKKFLLDSELDNESLLVTVTSIKTKVTETFKLNRTTRTSSHLEISKVK